jgi:hypothetical protein
MVLHGDRAIDRLEDAPNLLLDQIPETRAIARLALTDAMTLSAAASPRSAEMRTSSSASIVGTSIALERRSGASARRTMSSKRATILFFRARSPWRMRLEETRNWLIR